MKEAVIDQFFTEKIYRHSYSDRSKELITEARDNLLAHLKSAGLVIVPIEPTEAMILAGISDGFWDDGGDPKTVYRTMITASTGEPHGKS